jgi:DNA (cytosine-5)-methyltransferase 1
VAIEDSQVSRFYEFFAGGGMARMGMGPGWRCLFANDFDPKKSRVYRRNWTDDVLRTGDVGKIKTSDLPDYAELVWGSFPCQDLSLAGGGAGLKGGRSGSFWPFWRLVEALIKEGRAPRMIVLENVCGTLTSHGGEDFSALCSALSQAGYKFGAVIIDAALFVPHSRPRLFIVAARNDIELPGPVSAGQASPVWHTRGLKTAYDKLDARAKNNWIWWNFPLPPLRNACFADLIEDQPTSVDWHTPEETQRLLALMSDLNLSKVAAAKNAGRRRVGAIYKRTRRDKNGLKVQRAEIRFDDVAGCLRTPAGGSSRQLIMVIEGMAVKSRLISSRETARLMGLPDDYKLPDNYNEAYHLTGDGVVVPVVRHIAAHILEPILKFSSGKKKKAA